MLLAMTAKAPKSVAKSALRKVHATSRRQEYSASTRRALVDVATELFTAQGYAGTSLDEIVGGARVTKGALYHHFSGKQALFESVFEKVEERSARADPPRRPRQRGPLGQGTRRAAGLPRRAPGAVVPAGS